jgi:hypothetical protein
MASDLVRVPRYGIGAKPDDRPCGWTWVKVTDVTALSRKDPS